MLEDMMPVLAIGSALVAIGGAWAVVKFKQDNETDARKQEVAAVRQQHKDDVAELQGQLDRSERERSALRTAFESYKDSATDRRERLTDRLHMLEITVAASDGAYKAINDRFTSLEKAMEVGFRGVRDEIHGRQLRRDEQT